MSPVTGIDLQSRVSAIRWYHTIDLGGGVVTRGVDDSPMRLARARLPESLHGLTVLDIGAWDGFFSFECERRGAARVVAADHFSWHGSGWGTKAGFLLAREALGSRVEDLDIDVMDLTPERVGTFDVVLFLGVLYHLRHPFLALEQVVRDARSPDPGNGGRPGGFRRPAMAFIGTRAEQRSDELVGAEHSGGSGHAGEPRLHASLLCPFTHAAYRAARASITGFAGRTPCVRHFVRTAPCSTRGKRKPGAVRTPGS
jgi:SAM-dependent methyltransferase